MGREIEDCLCGGSSSSLGTTVVVVPTVVILFPTVVLTERLPVHPGPGVM